LNKASHACSEERPEDALLDCLSVGHGAPIESFGFVPWSAAAAAAAVRRPLRPFKRPF
jgi:hypothetical protein